MKKYKPCKVCPCGDCKDGTYRIGTWYCPIYKLQICDICCHYDMQDHAQCKKIKCKHWIELFIKAKGKVK